MEELITEKDYPIQKIWIFKWVISVLMLCTVIAIMSYWTIYVNTDSQFVMDILTQNERTIYLFVYAIALPLSIIIAVLRRANFHYSLEPHLLILRQGVIVKQTRHMHYGVIQNILVKQDLFDRIFGLASLVIQNASSGSGLNTNKQPVTDTVGFYANTVAIPALKQSDAYILKDLLLNKMKEFPIQDGQSGL